MQSTLPLAVNAMDVQSVADAIKALGDEWDQDCALAYEIGQFDISREQWIAQGIQTAITKWEPATRYYDLVDLNNALYDIHHIAQEYDRYECGLPMESYVMNDLRQVLINYFNLRVNE